MTRLYRRWGIGAWPRWTIKSTGISATSHAPNEGSADTRHVTPAFVSSSRARSTAAVRKPTGNCKPTVFALRPRMTSRRRPISSIVAPPETRRKKKLFFVKIAKIERANRCCPRIYALFFSRSISSRQGVGNFTPPFRRASFASSTWSSVVEIVKTFMPGFTRAAVPTGAPNAARMPSEMRSAPAPVAILFSRSTLCGYRRSLRWYAFPAFFAMYRFAEIRAASRAMCRIWHASAATRWIFTGNFVRGSPISNWLIRIPGTPPMYSLRAYAWPRISRYMLPGLRVISGGARSGGRYLTLPRCDGSRQNVKCGAARRPRCDAPREARWQRSDRQGTPPNRAPRGDSAPRVGARGRPAIPARRPWGRFVRTHPRPPTPAEPRRRLGREADRGVAGPARCEGARWSRCERAPQRRDRGDPDRTIGCPEPQRRDRRDGGSHPVPGIRLDGFHARDVRGRRPRRATRHRHLFRRRDDARARACVPSGARNLCDRCRRPLHRVSEAAPRCVPARGGTAARPRSNRVLIGIGDRRHGEHRRKASSHVRDRGPCGRMSHRQR